MSRIHELFSIEGRTALVTGGSVGIGEMIARAYVEAGARVYIASRNIEDCERVASELASAGTCIALRADLSTEDGARGLAAEVTDREGSLDILVNNAGATWGASLDEYPARAWDRVLDLNVKGLFFLTQSLLPALRAAGTPERPARIINISSIEGIWVPGHATYAYSASKAAVNQLTRTLAHRLARERITVNAILPGPFRSRMMKALLEANEEGIAALSPLGRIGNDDDMAAAAIYLASPGASWITGVLHVVDGGISST
jgi:NAD(P)-dependent dehydrogenase (short-subunit alcohol dehydrogenase family)